jgi:uncharacterized membrane protein YGL010W
MKDIHWLLNKYGESHQNQTNKAFHWICVPLIMLSLLGLLRSIPFLVSRDFLLNWGTVVVIGALVYYLRLSIPLFVGFLIFSFILLWINHQVWLQMDKSYAGLALFSLIVFVLAWIGQFIGHKIEGKKPSFLEDIQFLLIGPAWLMHFIYRKLGLTY